MALTTYNITGNLEDAFGAKALLGEVTFMPAGTTEDARVDGADAMLGPIRYSIADLPSPMALTEGAWVIAIRPTGRVNGDAQFRTKTIPWNMTAATTWGAIVASAADPVPLPAPTFDESVAGVLGTGGQTDTALRETFGPEGVPTTPTSIQSTATLTTAVPGTTPTPRWLSADGGRTFGFWDGGARLYDSTDGGATWRLLKAFAAAAIGVREMENGELLVALQTNPGEMWVSSGYAAGAGGSAATWTKTLTMSVPSAHADNRYSWSPPLHHMDDLPSGVDMGIMLVGEYGAPSEAPDKVYLSEDYGLTWRVVFDPTSAAGHHHHGVAYDPWGDAIWVSTGDGSAEKQLAYSTDWRNATPTWTQVALGTAQPVAIWPTRDAIYLGSDLPPNGIHRIERLSGPTGYGPLTTPYRADYNMASLTYLVQMIYKRPGHPLIFSFGVNDTGGAAAEDKGFVVFSTDGREFTEVWRDPIEYVDTTYTGIYGAIGAFGPTAQNTIVGHIRDDSRGTGAFPYHSRLSAPWPEFAYARPEVAAKAYAYRLFADAPTWQRHIAVPVFATPKAVSGLTSLIGGTTDWFGASRQGNLQNQFAEWDVPLLDGNWTLDAMFTKVSTGGILTFSIDGVDIGTIDTYNASSVRATGSIAFTVAKRGTKALRVRVATRNASNTTGWAAIISAINLTRTSL